MDPVPIDQLFASQTSEPVPVKTIFTPEAVSASVVRDNLMAQTRVKNFQAVLASNIKNFVTNPQRRVAQAQSNANGFIGANFQELDNSFTKAVNQVGVGVGIDDPVWAAEQVSLREEQFPRSQTHNTIPGRVIGGVVPLIGASIANPAAGLAIGVSQGAGSAEEEGSQNEQSGYQTAAIGTERAIFNGLLGLIPGSSGAGGFVKQALSKTLEAAGINIGQAAFEANLKTDLGIKSPAAWDAIKESATSGEQWAQALLLGGIHGLVSRTKPESSGDQGRPASPAVGPNIPQLGDSLATRLGDVPKGKPMVQSPPMVQEPVPVETLLAGPSISEARQEIEARSAITPIDKNVQLANPQPEVVPPKSEALENLDIQKSQPFKQSPPLQPQTKVVESEAAPTSIIEARKAIEASGIKPTENLVSLLSGDTLPNVDAPTAKSKLLSMYKQLTDIQNQANQIRQSEADRVANGGKPGEMDVQTHDKIHDIQTNYYPIMNDAVDLMKQTYGESNIMHTWEFLQALRENPEAEPSSKVEFSGRKSTDAGQRSGGFIDFTPIIDGALKAGKWVGGHVALAADWIKNTLGGVVNPSSIRSALVGRFGGRIKPFVDQVISFVQSLNETPKTKAPGTEIPTGQNVTPYKTMIDSLTSSSNGTYTRDIANKVGDVADKAREFRQQTAGDVQPILDKVSKPSKASYQLNDITPAANDPKVFYGNLRAGLENNNGIASQVPTEAQKLLSAADTANRAIGKQAFSINTQGGAPTGKMQRMPTRQMFADILADNQRWKNFQESILKENPTIAKAQNDAAWEGVRKDLRQGLEPAAEKAIAQEFSRTVQNMPSGVIDNQTPVWYLHDQPFDYFRKAQGQTAARVAFKQSPLDAVPMSEIKENLGKESQTGPGKYEDLVRALHNQPTDWDNVTRSIQDSWVGTALRAWHEVAGIPYSLALAGASIHTATSLLDGQGPRAYGIMKSLRGTFNGLVSDRESLQKANVVDRITTDLALRPDSPVMSSLDAAQNVLKAPNNYAHQMIALQIGAIATDAAREAQTGNLTSGQQQDFINKGRLVGMDRNVLEQLSQGKGSQEDYDNYARRITSFLSGRNLEPAEISKLENTKLFGQMFRAMRYPLNNIRVMDKVTRMVLNDGFKGDLPQLQKSVAMFARQTAGLTISGIRVSLLAALLTGGMGGLKMALQENKDKLTSGSVTDQTKYLGSMILSGLGGPLSAVNKLTSGGGIGSFSYDFGLLTDMLQAAGGAGHYKDMDMIERFKQFTSERGRLGVVANTWWGIMASGGESPDLDNALKGLNRWKADNQVPTISTEEAGDPEGFRAQMRRAVAEIRKGNDPSDFIIKALGAKDRVDIETSLKDRQVLAQLSPEQLNSLRDRIGSKLVDKLQDYDDTLAAWGESYKLPSRYSSRGMTSDAQAEIGAGKGLYQDNIPLYKERVGLERQRKGLKNEDRVTSERN